MPGSYRGCDLNTNSAPTQDAAVQSLVPSDAQDDLHPLIDKEAYSHHGHNFEISDAQSNPVTPPSSFSPDPPCCLRHAQPVPIAYYGSDLHSPSDNL